MDDRSCRGERRESKKKKKKKKMSTGNEWQQIEIEDGLSILGKHLSMERFTSFGMCPLTPHLSQFCLSIFECPSVLESVAWPYLFNGRNVVAVMKKDNPDRFFFYSIPAIVRMSNRKESTKAFPRCLIITACPEAASLATEFLHHATLQCTLNTVGLYGLKVLMDEHLEKAKTADVIVATLGCARKLLSFDPHYVDALSMLILDDAVGLIGLHYDGLQDLLKGISTTTAQVVIVSEKWDFTEESKLRRFQQDHVRVVVEKLGQTNHSPPIKRVHGILATPMDNIREEGNKREEGHIKKKIIQEDAMKLIHDHIGDEKRKCDQDKRKKKKDATPPSNDEEKLDKLISIMGLVLECVNDMQKRVMKRVMDD